MSDTNSQNTGGYGSGYGKRPLWQWILIYVIIGAIVYGLIYYFVIAKRGGYNSGYNNSNTNPSYQQSNTTVTNVTTKSNDAKTFTIDATEFSFKPDAFTLSAGEPVTLTFRNMGKYPHNFTISALNIHTKTIQPGESDTITFTPSKAGLFEYICSVDSHADKGMKGTLTVK